jgi:hypothetical protein
VKWEMVMVKSVNIIPLIKCRFVVKREIMWIGKRRRIYVLGKDLQQNLIVQTGGDCFLKTSEYEAIDKLTKPN